MNSNLMLASYGWTQGWLYEVLVYDIDYSLKTKRMLEIKRR